VPKITSVEPQKKNPRRYNIFLDGKFAFGADEDTVVKMRLVEGKDIAELDLEKIIFETQIGKLMEKMYGLFSVRNRSEKEIRDYLKRKNWENKIKDKDEVSDLVIEALIENLKRKEMINDKAFAQSWVEGRRRSKKKGNRALAAELFQKGIDPETIQEVINTDDNQEKLAEEALQKKMKSFSSLPEKEFFQRAVTFLMRKGFDFSIAKSAVEKILKKE
jgi:regulatory protein